MLKGKKKIICLVMVFLMMTVVPAQNVSAGFLEQGIDVSKWQGNIDWIGVAQSGVKFAIIRVGNTKKGVDPQFYYNMLAAQAVGIKTGVYIYSYATSVEEAALEAQFVLAAIKDIKVNYPIVWDVEDDSQLRLTRDTLSLMANTFCAIIEAEGYHPMVYSNREWFTKKIGPVFFDKWVAQWGTKCDIPDASIWQYSSTGKIAGIKGDVDLDYSLKDYSGIIVDTGWVARKGFLYFYNNYKMQRGWLELPNSKYYLDPNGRMVTGWLQQEEGLYFFQPDGTMSLGFTPIGAGMYYFDSNGHMLTGLQNLNNLTYYFAENGVMYTGFLKLADGTRFFDVDGHMYTGLNNIGNQLFLFDDISGIMKTGWNTIGEQHYLFSAEGPMIRGWFDDGNNKYYLSLSDGHRVSGWEIIDGKTYFFDGNGHMLTGMQEFAGLKFLFDSDGAMYTGWFNDGKNMKYFEMDGHMVTGLVNIDNAIYMFDSEGNMVTGIIEIGGVPYLFGEDGKMVIAQ